MKKNEERIVKIAMEALESATMKIDELGFSRIRAYGQAHETIETIWCVGIHAHLSEECLAAIDNLRQAAFHQGYER